MTDSGVMAVDDFFTSVGDNVGLWIRSFFSNLVDKVRAVTQGGQGRTGSNQENTTDGIASKLSRVQKHRRKTKRWMCSSVQAG